MYDYGDAEKCENVCMVYRDAKKWGMGGSLV